MRGAVEEIEQLDCTQEPPVLYRIEKL